EREMEQRVHCDLALEADCAPAAASDALTDAVDYVEACRIAARTAVEGRFHLVETLAERVCEALLAQLACTAVEIEVRKPSAVPAAGWVGVSMRRERAR
ncbi:MAG: dihydroneopterin aldolase, partial [Planctomycetota bacterium]